MKTQANTRKYKQMHGLFANINKNPRKGVYLCLDLLNIRAYDHREYHWNWGQGKLKFVYPGGLREYN